MLLRIVRRQAKRYLLPLLLLEIYMCGGYDEVTPYNDFWELDTNNFQWSKLDITLPANTYFHAVALQRSYRNDDSVS